MENHFENFNGEPKALTDADIENYIHDQQHRDEWAEAVTAIAYAKRDRDASVLLPFFEAECARSYEHTNLVEIRRMTHYLDARAGIQKDLPNISIANFLRTEAGREKTEWTLARQDKNDIEEKALDWEMDIKAFESKTPEIEGVLRRMEIIIRDLEESIDRISQLTPGVENQVEVNNKKVEVLEKKLSFARAGRSTLLEQYFSPGSLH